MDKNKKAKVTGTSSKADEDTISKTAEIDDVREKKPPRWFAKTLISFLIVALAYVLWLLWAPGWVHKTQGPVMEAGRTTGVTDRVNDLTKRVKGIENLLQIHRAELNKLSESFSRFGLTEDNKTIKAFGDVQNFHSTRLKSLVVKLNNLEKALEALSSPPKSSKALAKLKELRTNAGQNLTDLRKKNETLNKTIQNLEERLEALESIPQIKLGSGKRGALLLAVGQLKNSVATSNDYVGPLNVLRSLSPESEKNSKDFLTLEKFSASGVKDFLFLRQKFQQISNDIVRASYTPAGEGWVDQTLFKLSQLVTFRRTGPEGALRNDVAGQVARAEMRLAARDLRGAVVIINGLLGDAAKISEQWLADAEARLAVDSAIASLFSNAITTGYLDAVGK